MQGCLLHQMPSVFRESGCCSLSFWATGGSWLDYAQQEKPHSYCLYIVVVLTYRNFSAVAAGKHFAAQTSSGSILEIAKSNQTM